MTLVLTEASPLGIVMAADSAYTSATTGNVRYGEKLFLVPYLSAGLSFWGTGLPKRPEEWISEFIHNNQSSPNLADLGIRLQDSLRQVILPLPQGVRRSTLGFHLAGLTTASVPIVFHVHNGESTVLTARGQHVDPRLVNCNDDLPESLAKSVVLGRGQGFILRNGDFLPYAAIWNQVGPLAEGFAAFIKQAAGQQWTLEDRGLFVAAQVEIMKVLYSSWRQNRLSGKIAPAIGGGVKYLVIGPNRPSPAISTAAFQ